MAGQDKEELDASEPATPFKLEKARERGSIARSNELAFAFVLLACIGCTYGLGIKSIDGIARLLRGGLSLSSHESLNEASALNFLYSLGLYVVGVLAPVVFIIWVTALTVGVLQARGVFSTHPLTPDFSRLNPANGLKRIFSTKALHELWRSSAKITVIGVAMWLWAQRHVAEILRLPGQNPQTLERSGMGLFGSALALLTCIIFLFALLDWGLNRREFMKKMRMSKREIKDEHKEREGDPRIKKRLRELRMAWLNRARQLSKVRSASVLLVNPTHYAVALEYRHGKMPAPVITARGAGEFAARMRKEAYRHAVPVVENARLARSLFALPDSQVLVPEEHFDATARVLRWVFATRGRESARSRA